MRGEPADVVDRAAGDEQAHPGSLKEAVRTGEAVTESGSVGAWDSGPFDNDDAADFAGQLDEADPNQRIVLIREALQAGRPTATTRRRSRGRSPPPRCSPPPGSTPGRLQLRAEVPRRRGRQPRRARRPRGTGGRWRWTTWPTATPSTPSCSARRARSNAPGRPDDHERGVGGAIWVGARSAHGNRSRRLGRPQRVHPVAAGRRAGPVHRRHHPAVRAGSGSRTRGCSASSGCCSPSSSSPTRSRSSTTSTTSSRRSSGRRRAASCSAPRPARRPR